MQKRIHTGMSIILTTALVLRSPMIISRTIKTKNKMIKQATEAGKDTELSPIREETPKHARSIIRTPKGMKIQQVKFRCHDSRATWRLSALPTSFGAGGVANQFEGFQPICYNTLEVISTSHIIKYVQEIRKEVVPIQVIFLHSRRGGRGRGRGRPRPDRNRHSTEDERLRFGGASLHATKYPRSTRRIFSLLTKYHGRRFVPDFLDDTARSRYSI